MSLPSNTYYYNNQIRRYLIQFMQIFAGLQVSVGQTDTREKSLIAVPVTFGMTDRVVAAIRAQNTQNAPIRLPLMSVWCRNIELDESRFKGIGTERRNTYTPVGGLVPDDTITVYQRMPVPYVMTVELAIYASSWDQEFQILEQLLPLFDPALTIQTSTAPLDWTRLTHVVLKGVDTDTALPTGPDRRVLQKTLRFSVPIYMDIPADIRKNLIETIRIRVGATSNFDDIIGEFDQQGLEYVTVHDASALVI